MATTLKAEMWDRMQFLFRNYYDRMVHAKLTYEGSFDMDVLKNVVIYMVEKAPVLHSSFNTTVIEPYWKEEKYTVDDIVSYQRVEDADEAADKWLLEVIPYDNNVQVKLAVFEDDKHSILAWRNNHMCMDGGDFKYFLKAFCKNYNDYIENGVSPVDLREGSRSYDQVYNDFSKTEQRMARNLYKNINAKDDHKFPLTPDSIRDRSFIAKRKISAEKLAQIKAAGKKHGATVNDMLLTAYFYSLYTLANYSPYEGVSISCAIDLRRHLKDVSDEGLTNHTAWMQCKVPERGKDIFQTLQYVKHSSNQFKQDKFMGLYGLPLLKLGYTIMPHAASEEIIKIGYSNPLLAMSNIGILEADKLALCGHEPTDGFMTGAVKYKPFVLLSATTMHNVVTLSMCVRGNDEDKKTVERFFDLMEQSLDALTAGA